MIEVPLKYSDVNSNLVCEDLQPRYAHPGDAGCDACANIPQTIYVEEGCRMLIPTGISVAVPEGYRIEVCPRSGIALKNGVTVLNAPGLIDQQFRGEIGVILMNHGGMPFEVTPGMRIAQLVLSKFETITWQVVDELPSSDRGTNGFGSSGV